MQSHKDIDYFMFGHRHIELYAAEDRRREQVRIERENDDSGKRKRG
jgi:hypothetical protein